MTCAPASNTSNGIQVSEVNHFSVLSGAVERHNDRERSCALFSRRPRQAARDDAGTKLGDFPSDADLHFGDMRLIGIKYLFPVTRCAPQRGLTQGVGHQGPATA